MTPKTTILVAAVALATFAPVSANADASPPAMPAQPQIPAPAPKPAPTFAAQAPIEIPGGPAHFDFMVADPSMHRVLACHPGAKSLVVLDTTTNQPTVIETGEVNGVDVDPVENKYFAAGGGQSIAVIDRTTLKKVADIPTTGPCDDVVYDPANGLVYVDHDDGTEVWVVDPKTNKITGTVAVAGAPEVMVYDPATDKVYQNIKPTDQTQVIDPKTGAVTASWSTTPAHSPHGLAIDSQKGLLFSAGKNGKLVAIDIKTGTVTSDCDIAQGVDQIAYDSAKHRVYCACGSGAVSIVHVTRKGALKPVEDITVPKGTHSIAFDGDSKGAWIAYSTDTGSFLQAFKQTEVASK